MGQQLGVDRQKQETTKLKVTICHRAVFISRMWSVLKWDYVVDMISNEGQVLYQEINNYGKKVEPNQYIIIRYWPITDIGIGV